MGDEAGELRAALERGEWRRLTDPLLPLVLLDDPGTWWRAARWACVQTLLDGAGHCAPIALGTIGALQLLWDLAETRCLRPDELAALEVLEQWPAG